MQILNAELFTHIFIASLEKKSTTKRPDYLDESLRPFIIGLVFATLNLTHASFKNDIHITAHKRSVS